MSINKLKILFASARKTCSLQEFQHALLVVGRPGVVSRFTKQSGKIETGN